MATKVKRDLGVWAAIAAGFYGAGIGSVVALLSAELATEKCLFSQLWFQGIFGACALLVALGFYMTAGLFWAWVPLPATLAERARAEREQREDAARATFKEALGEADQEALAILGSEDGAMTFDEWNQRVAQLITDAAGVGEVALYVSNAGFPHVVPLQQHASLSNEDAVNMSRRRQRIGELLQRIHHVGILETFDPQQWQEFRPADED